MSIDKKGNIGGKINIIDISVIIVIIITFFGIAFRFYSTPSKNARETVRLRYVIKVYGVRKYSIDAISKKGIVIDSDQKCEMGEISDVSYTPEIWEQFDSEGNIVYAEVPKKYNVEVAILAEGRESEDGYYIGNNIDLSVGSKINLATKYANLPGTVTSIERVP